MRQYNENIVLNAVMNATINSAPIPANQLYGYSVQAVYTGTPTGTLKLQASDDPFTGNIQTSIPPTNWVDIANSSFAISSAGAYMWNVSEVMYNWARLVYTDSSGGTSTAVLNVTVNGKGI